MSSQVHALHRIESHRIAPHRIAQHRTLTLTQRTVGSNPLERWESKVAVNYALFSLLETFLSLILITHWFACFLGTIHSWQTQAAGRLPCDRDANVLSSESDCTWLENYASGWQNAERLSSFDKYTICVYWAVGEIMSLITGAPIGLLVPLSVLPVVPFICSSGHALICPSV